MAAARSRVPAVERERGFFFICTSAWLLEIVGALLIAVVTLGSPLIHGQQISVGSNVQVSVRYSERAHSEVLISADPTDANHLLACSIILSEEQNIRSTIVYLSLDGGQTWQSTLETGKDVFSADPACVLGSHGIAYFVTVIRNQSAKISHESFSLRIYRSKDGGRSWLSPTDATYLDRESILLDETIVADNEWIYINGFGAVRDVDGQEDRTALGLLRSNDHGRTFEGPTLATVFAGGYVDAMGNCAVLPSGTLACIVSRSRNSDSVDVQLNSDRLDSVLQIVTSRDAGRSFSAAKTVSKYVLRRRPPGTTAINPVLAVDATNGCFKNRIYTVWPDTSSGRVRVLFAYSQDEGKTWSEPTAVDDDRPFQPADPALGPDDFMPTIAVNRDGVVGIMWYDRRDNPDNLGWYVRFRASLDGGETFLPSVRVSSAPSSFGKDERWIISSAQPISGGGTPSGRGGLLKVDLRVQGQHFTGGDYAGMAADARGIFHPLWIDNRTGLPQIWTSSIEVKGHAMLNGSHEMASLDDVTDRITVDLSNITYDRERAELSLNARLKNTSQDVITRPIIIRVLKLHSDVGSELMVLGADNSELKEGAVWDFTNQLDHEMLAPGEMTTSRQLSFQLSDVGPLSSGGSIRLGLVNVQMRVLARIKH